ncbi:MAG: diguanylate cyclase [Candidatus Omnitrophica bacterium]|nr:diguanylate cyclase [Candidatus Omnitrophota bacterium]
MAMNRLRSLRQGLILAPRGIRSNVLCAFLLMSVVPLTMLLLTAAWFAFPTVREFYHLERWFPVISSPGQSTWWLIGLLSLTILISLLGSLYLATKIIEPVIRISQSACRLAEGGVAQTLPIERYDELGELTSALNQVTTRVRTNMAELKQLSERTTQINLEIRRQVVTLSGLLQIGELISKGGELEMILDLIVERLAMLDTHGFSFLCLQPIHECPMALRRTSGIDIGELKSIAFDSARIVIDANNPPTPMMTGMWEHVNRPNLLLQPVLIHNRPLGVLGVGNRHPHYCWPSEIIELLAIFGKQTSIAVEGELLLRKAKALSIHDELTGVYNEPYIWQRLAEEIKRAALYQRPCAVAVFAIGELAAFRRSHGEAEAQQALKRLTRLLQESVTEIDRIGRFKGNELVVILPERNKRQALVIAQEIRQRAAALFAGAAEPQDRLTLLGGVAENPLDGVTPEALIHAATTMMRGNGRPAGQPAAAVSEETDGSHEAK